MNDLKPDKGPSDEEILLIIQKAFYAGFEAGRIDGAWRGINPTGTATVCKARFLEWIEKAADEISNRNSRR